ncbi:MAG TPA: NADH-quinone oxidoreductase subunit C [Armatimonadota bacterium]|nr:NADH-quinone oxidoreductase subunit C [Armatimonadota bacterium]
MALSSEQIEQAVRNRFPESVEETGEISGVPTLLVRADAILDICAFLKEEPGLSFDYLMSLTAVDWPDRLDVVYHLYSILQKHYVTLKVRADRATPVVPSVTSVWKAANWQEREVYDMFGIRFEGHPDLRRILLEPDWEGFPLRKDYVER